MKLHTVIKQSKHWTNISQTVLEMSTNNDCYEAPENCKSMSQRTSKCVFTCHTTVYQLRGKSYQRLTLLTNKQYKIEHLHTEN